MDIEVVPDQDTLDLNRLLHGASCSTLSLLCCFGTPVDFNVSRYPNCVGRRPPWVDVTSYIHTHSLQNGGKSLVGGINNNQ